MALDRNDLERGLRGIKALLTRVQLARNRLKADLAEFERLGKTPNPPFDFKKAMQELDQYAQALGRFLKDRESLLEEVDSRRAQDAEHEKKYKQIKTREKEAKLDVGYERKRDVGFGDYVLIADYEPLNDWLDNIRELEKQFGTVRKERVDLTQLPTNVRRYDGRVHKMGDMHACGPKFVHFNIRNGMAAFNGNKNEYAEFVQLCALFANKEQLRADQLSLPKEKFQKKYGPMFERLQALINKLDFKSEAVQLMLGDIFQDRNGNDVVTAMLFKRAKDCGAQLIFMLGNHEGMFIQWLMHLMKGDAEPIDREHPSSDTANILIEMGIISADKFIGMLNEAYFPNLVACYYEVDDRGRVHNPGTHAPNGVREKYLMAQGLAVYALNAEFQEHYADLFDDQDRADLARVAQIKWNKETGISNEDYKFIMDVINRVLHKNAIKEDKKDLARLIYLGVKRYDFKEQYNKLVDKGYSDEEITKELERKGVMITHAQLNGHGIDPKRCPFYRLFWNRDSPELPPPEAEIYLHHNGHDDADRDIKKDDPGWAHNNIAYNDKVGQLPQLMDGVMQTGVAAEGLHPMARITAAPALPKNKKDALVMIKAQFDRLDALMDKQQDDISDLSSYAAAAAKPLQKELMALVDEWERLKKGMKVDGKLPEIQSGLGELKKKIDALQGQIQRLLLTQTGVVRVTKAQNDVAPLKEKLAKFRKKAEEIIDPIVKRRFLARIDNVDRELTDLLERVGGLHGRRYKGIDSDTTDMMTDIKNEINSHLEQQAKDVEVEDYEPNDKIKEKLEAEGKDRIAEIKSRLTELEEGDQKDEMLEKLKEYNKLYKALNGDEWPTKARFKAARHVLQVKLDLLEEELDEVEEQQVEEIAKRKAQLAREIEEKKKAIAKDKQPAKSPAPASPARPASPPVSPTVVRQSPPKPAAGPSRASEARVEKEKEPEELNAKKTPAPVVAPKWAPVVHAAAPAPATPAPRIATPVMAKFNELERACQDGVFKNAKIDKNQLADQLYPLRFKMKNNPDSFGKEVEALHEKYVVEASKQADKNPNPPPPRKGGGFTLE